MLSNCPEAAWRPWHVDRILFLPLALLLSSLVKRRVGNMYNVNTSVLDSVQEPAADTMPPAVCPVNSVILMTYMSTVPGILQDPI